MNLSIVNDEKIVLIAWGMRLDEEKHTSDGKWFKTAVKYDKKKISFDLAGHGKLENNYSKYSISYDN